MPRSPNIPKVLPTAASEAVETLNALITETVNQVRGPDRLAEERNYHGKSPFEHPLGAKAHEKPKLRGEILWAGYPLDGRELTPNEIQVLNLIEPGMYHDGQWEVRDLAPGSRTTRRLLVLFPCLEPDQRASLPSMTAMCEEMIAEVRRSMPVAHDAAGA